MKTQLCLSLAVVFLGVSAFAQLSDQGATGAPAAPGAKVETYKTSGDVKLNLYVYSPPGHQPEDRRPAIVFFFGGGWHSGSPQQFQRQCEYLASRGMVGITADYRVFSRNGTKADRCVADGKSAIRWVRIHASKLGVHPHRIVAAGGSAGGHVAACTGIITGFEEVGEDLTVSSAPNALILFNPVLVLAPIEELPDLRLPEHLNDRMGVPPVKISPYHQIRSNAPPTLILHGKADTVTPYLAAEKFTAKMLQTNNRCELAGFEDQQHGFFNFGRNGNRLFIETMRRADQFLVSLGYLDGKDTVDEFLKRLR